MSWIATTDFRRRSRQIFAWSTTLTLYMRNLYEGIKVTTDPGEAHWTRGFVERQHEALRIGV